MPRKRSAMGSRSKLKEEQKRMLVEMAAAAYVRMTHGDYKYPEGARKGRVQEDGSRINKRELMRIAGYNTSSTNTHYDRLEEDEYYQQMIALYERRYTDPLFKDDQVSKVWETVGNEALRNVYERLTYYPHQLTIEQLLKVLKVVLEAGVTLNKIGADNTKTDRLVKSIKDPEQKAAVKDAIRKNLRKQLEELERDV